MRMRWPAANTTRSPQLRLVFPIPVSLLPAAPGAGHRHGEVEETARHAVAALTDELNRVAGPVVEALERS